MKMLLALLLALVGVLFWIVELSPDRRRGVENPRNAQALANPGSSAREKASTSANPGQAPSRSIAETGSKAVGGLPRQAVRPASEAGPRPVPVIGPTFAKEPPVHAPHSNRNIPSEIDSLDQSVLPDDEPFAAPSALRLPFVLLGVERVSSTDAVFVNPAPTAEDGILARLRDEFVEKIGGPDQDPGDPEYARRWQLALGETDRTYRAFYGKQAYLVQDIAAAKEAYSQRAAGR